jgi:hypothetical protein
VLLVRIPNGSSVTEDLQMQVNGDSGTNYDYRQQDGTPQTGQSAISFGRIASDFKFRIGMQGLLSSTWGGEAQDHYMYDSAATQFKNSALTGGYVDTITFLSSGGSNFDLELDVFGV